ncbi:MAG: hypothetical protein ACMXX9_01285 [Candidatus Woesearchaeota archaeon]
MTNISLFLRINLHKELRNYSFFDIGNNSNYFDEYRNKEYVKEYVNSKLVPAIDFLSSLKDEKLKFNLSVSGVALEMFEKYHPEAVLRLKEFVKFMDVEMVGEPHHNSISYLFSKDEFDYQVKYHSTCIKKVFGLKPVIFRNSDLSYHGEVDKALKGYKAMIIKSNIDSNQVYKSKNGLNLIISSSDLVVCKNKDINVLTVDFEMFENVEYQEALTSLLKEHKFVFGSELAGKKASEFNEENNKSSFIQAIQKSAINEVIKLEKIIKASHDDSLIETWRHLTSCVHYHKMCSSNLKSVESPYDVFISFNNVLKDLAIKAENN